eukprot:TRINITY_DN1323_c0_g1_i1.p1 TRINITY_DN1323_c0_g1~~TRINITY_DN1323_c0_g1_i1.p1  ORF type:complete len:430 (-),score=38.34 TRINITY_DN1323_c0_g1_i1:327-1502(-)
MFAVHQSLNRSQLSRAPAHAQSQSRCRDRGRFVCVSYNAPSMAPAKSELESLSRWSVVVPDTIQQTKQECPTAATVSAMVLEGIMNNPAGDRIYKNAIVTARTYQKCVGMDEESTLSCQYDKALANVGALFAEQVSGRVSVEVCPQASTTDELVAHGNTLLDLFQEMGVGKDRLLLRLPGSWEGIQAAKQLENQGINTHIAIVYSLVQAVAAGQNGASLVQINIGRLQDWYQKYPGIIRNPKGPREDSGCSSSSDPALNFVSDVFYQLRKFYPHTKLMVTGFRNKKDALNLAGCDFLVVTSKILQQLKDTPTSEGYNDGLSSQIQLGVECVLSEEKLDKVEIQDFDRIDEKLFRDQLGLVGQDLLQQRLESLRGDQDRIMSIFSHIAVGTE